MILHNEHSILSILQDTPGVIRHHGLFKETQRIILVLSCVYNHDYDQDKKWQVFINLSVGGGIYSSGWFVCVCVCLSVSIGSQQLLYLAGIRRYDEQTDTVIAQKSHLL